MDREVIIQGIPVDVYNVNGLDCVDLTLLYFIYIKSLNPNYSYILRKVSKENIISTRKRGANPKRENKILITFNGIVEIIAHSHSLSYNKKKELLDELRAIGVIDKYSISYSTSKQSTFFSVLQDILKNISIIKTIEYEKNIEPYRVDCIVNNKIIIEFNENNHNGYDKSKELIRYNYLESLGYKIIKVNDIDNRNEQIGIIINNIIN